MDKKQVKDREEVPRCTPPKIPPSWQLSSAQRAFIEDLWQDERSPLPEDPQP
ncbi:hypothetical protein V2T44_18140 [Serratia ficaria]|jgi:hypothetical protein|uniref:Uncharacterized protein n=1 Tax=Serratia ficaria TaxID=61651 RepID=A0A240CCD6_SERFI|nr:MULTISPECIES: hypothetical protein [Serratia]MEE4484859.1 hypothetical protein [Serratia ficaria]REF43300.1 hypothetical protein C7332_1543 [Serratia ficaria]CAI0700361.1 Uncharacterised protein [Serratia ficaria]CAI1063883.1 Uncharacterised protein [Serratia ficaria]CAI1111549.1 Uncharacterised protein [Serratia ficaria]